jgi:hypothetical protein
MNFLMGTATGKTATAKKTNPKKVLLPTKPFTTDEAATEWVEIHQECKHTNTRSKQHSRPWTP